MFIASFGGDRQSVDTKKRFGSRHRQTVLARSIAFSTYLAYPRSWHSYSRCLNQPMTGTRVVIIKTNKFKIGYRTEVKKLYDKNARFPRTVKMAAPKSNIYVSGHPPHASWAIHVGITRGPEFLAGLFTITGPVHVCHLSCSVQR